MFSMSRMVAALQPYGYDNLQMIVPVDGPGNALVLFWTKGDGKVALLNHNYDVVWCYSTGSSYTENHFMELECYMEEPEKYPRAPWDEHEGRRPQWPAARLWDELYGAIGRTDAGMNPHYYSRPAAMEAVKEQASIDIMRMPKEEFDAYVAGLPSGLLPNIKKPANDRPLPDRIAAERHEDEDTDVTMEQAMEHFSVLGATCSLFPNGKGFRLWVDQTYVCKLDVHDGIVDLEIVREADEMVKQVMARLGGAVNGV
jgi:hypothetical protein